MNAEQLNAIKERAAKATPGPWVSRNFTGGDIDVVSEGANEHGERNLVVDIHIGEESDAEFIAHAREDVPALVAEVERLKSLMAHIYEITHDTYYRKNEEDEYVVKQRYHEDRINIGEIMIVSAENSE